MFSDINYVKILLIWIILFNIYNFINYIIDIIWDSLLLYKQIARQIYDRGDYMANSELEILKKEINALREQIHAYMEYPDIFKDELVASSNEIDILINKYIALTNK